MQRKYGIPRAIGVVNFDSDDDYSDGEIVADYVTPPARRVKDNGGMVAVVARIAAAHLGKVATRLN